MIANGLEVCIVHIVHAAHITRRKQEKVPWFNETTEKSFHGLESVESLCSKASRFIIITLNRIWHTKETSVVPEATSRSYSNK